MRFYFRWLCLDVAEYKTNSRKINYYTLVKDTILLSILTINIYVCIIYDIYNLYFVSYKNNYVACILALVNHKKGVLV